MTVRDTMYDDALQEARELIKTNKKAKAYYLKQLELSGSEEDTLLQTSAYAFYEGF